MAISARVRKVRRRGQFVVTIADKIAPSLSSIVASIKSKPLDTRVEVIAFLEGVTACAQLKGFVLSPSKSLRKFRDATKQIRGKTM